MKNLIFFAVCCMSLIDGYSQLSYLTPSADNHTIIDKPESISLNFSVEEKAYGASIKWQSKADKVKTFLLEKSNNGKDFTTLKAITVKGKKSSELYTAKDSDMHFGKNYYRLILINEKGQQFTSEAKQLTHKKQNNFFVHFSDDNHDVLEISLAKKEKGSIRIFDQQFVLVKSIALEGDEDTFSVDISEFEAGEYLVQKQNKDSNYMKSFVK